MYDRSRKLRVFEAFAGIGAQATALERIGIDFEIVGISDWFIDAILCYELLHCDKPMELVIPSNEGILEYLESLNLSKDSVRPTDISKIKHNELARLYIANQRCKNLGSITMIKGSDMPDTDLFIYSFPCQDLSTGGKGLGMKKGSGTRSGLLWEVERILSELKKENRLPEYLLMENVKTIKAKSNVSDLNQWLSFLESLGYKNDECMILNSLDFGVPQDRERAFIVSHLEKKLNIDKIIDRYKQKKEYRFDNFFRTDYNNPILREEADEAQLNKTPSREVMWKINGKQLDKNTTVRTITCNMDRTNCAALFPYDGALGKSYRRPTIREAFLLMGFTEEEYEKTKQLGFSYRKMNKLIGNSIVVNVLESIFRAMFIDNIEVSDNGIKNTDKQEIPLF